jgi:MiaB-like tRNA modifying enzyme
MTGLVYAEGYGCPSNDYDLEIILSRFEAEGYTRVADPSEADVVVVNTCAVKKRTEDRVLNRLRLFEKLGKPVIVSGCLPLVNPEAVVKAAPNYVALLGPSSVERIDEVLHQKCRLRGINLVTGSRRPKVGMVTPKEGSVIEAIPVCEGCLGECTFCCTRLARMRLVSSSPDSIMAAMRLGLRRGVKEFWLTGQDVGAYGRDEGWDLPSLLRNISSIGGEFKVRVGMMNPEWCVEKLEELVEAFHDPKIFKFLHLPIQSGNDEVLRTMKRGYTVQDFISIVERFRREYPDITLWTDIICGYPTEDEEAFFDTLRVLERVEPDVVNISKFSTRPRTPAQRLRPLPSEVVKERSRRASILCERIFLSRNKRWLGWSGEVLVDEKGEAGTWIGRTDSYKPVGFQGSEGLFGRRVAVEVIDARPTHLVGILLISSSSRIHPLDALG